MVLIVFILRSPQNLLVRCMTQKLFEYANFDVWSFLFLVIWWIYKCNYMDNSWELSGQYTSGYSLNSLMVDVRDDFVQDDLLHSMSISNELYNTNLLQLPYFEISGPKVQYCTGRELLLFVPIMYENGVKMLTFLFCIFEVILLKVIWCKQKVHHKSYVWPNC